MLRGRSRGDTFIHECTVKHGIVEKWVTVICHRQWKGQWQTAIHSWWACCTSSHRLHSPVAQLLSTRNWWTSKASVTVINLLTNTCQDLRIWLYFWQKRSLLKVYISYQELEALSLWFWRELCWHGNNLVVSNNDGPAGEERKVS